MARRRSLLFLALLALAFASLSASIFFLIDQTKVRLNETIYDRGGLSGVQIQTHYERLMSALVGFEYQLPGASIEKVALEFDIAYERINAHPTRPPNDQFDDPEFTALNANLSRQFEIFVPKIDRLVAGETDMIPLLMAEFEALRPDIDRLASMTIQLSAELRDGNRRSNILAAERVAWLIIVLATLSLVFVLLIWFQYVKAEGQSAELLDLTASLRDANARVEAASRAKSEFLAHMSHELRTPLNSILAFSEVIRDGVLGKCEPAAYSDYAGDIHNSSRHLLGLIDGLLDLSRIDAQQLDLQDEESELAPHIDWVISLVANISQRAQVTVTLRETVPGLRILADSRRLRQMLLNLVDNAIKFSDPGGKVFVSAGLSEQGQLMLTVEDNGRGIPEKDLLKVLEPFHRGDAGAYHATQGAGLGLSIVRSLIQVHGGHLTIDSDGKSGTTATLHFPAERVLGAGV
jgi:signal transduction histidine kinase